MRSHAIHARPCLSALLVLLVLPACRAPGRGARVTVPPETTPLLPPAPAPEVPGTPVAVVDRCGPQPSPEQVRWLVRREHPGRAARDLGCSRLERWCVTGGRQLWGWRVVVDITEETGSREEETGRHAYLIRKQPQGLAIVAAAEGEADAEGFAWSLREPDEVERAAREQARHEQEQERLRQAWDRAREVPTREELVSADFGPAPKRYRKIIRDHLRREHGLTESARLRLHPPVKTWARWVASGHTVFGWRVTATVLRKPEASGEPTRHYHFMFRRGKVISTTRLGKGFQLVVDGEPPEPPPSSGAAAR